MKWLLVKWHAYPKWTFGGIGRCVVWLVNRSYACLKWTSTVGVPAIKWFLNRLYGLREKALGLVVYSSLHIFGYEDITLKDVIKGAFEKNELTNEERCLDGVQDADEILALAKAAYQAAVDRRTALTDKCKTLLTVTALSIALIGLYLPKSFDFGSTLMRWIFVGAGLCLVNALILLLVYIGVAIEKTVALNAGELGLDKANLKKSQINSYRDCRISADNRTDFLLAVYLTARCFALSGFLILASLFFIGYVTR
jgi:hypothetical protein